MAIIPGVQGLKASIIVDGDALTEYTDEDEEIDDPRKETTVYVESQVGKTFSVQWVFEQDFVYASDNAIVCRLYLDGSNIGGRVIPNAFPSIHNISGARYSEAEVWKQSDFHFANIVFGEVNTLVGIISSC